MGCCKPIKLDDCRRYLEETTFRLRPADYDRRYPKWPGAVGLEIEMLPVIPPADGAEAPGPVPLQGRDNSTAALLRITAARRGWTPIATEDASNDPMLMQVALDDDGGVITFEPGGQVEFSTRPYPCLVEAATRLRAVQAQLDEAYRGEGWYLTQAGINPWHSLDRLGLQMPKARYRAMDQHFAAIGPYGQRMMRQTCTFQVNLDFGPTPESLCRRYLAAQLIAPLAAATFANSPVLDGRLAEDHVRGFRTRIWRHADPSRTGLPGLVRIAARPSREACIDSYLEFALAAEVVFVAAAGYRRPERKVTFGEWLGQPIFGHAPTIEDFSTHLSLLFAEVRPRGFLELRSADCLPRAFQLVPAAWWTGLLYHEPTLTRVLEMLTPRAGVIEPWLWQADRGLEDPELRGTAQAVMRLAMEGFSGLSACFKSAGGERELSRYNEIFTARGRTPGDDLRDLTAASGGRAPGWTAWLALAERWLTMAG